MHRNDRKAPQDISGSTSRYRSLHHLLSFTSRTKTSRTQMKNNFCMFNARQNYHRVSGLTKCTTERAVEISDVKPVTPLEG